MIGAGITGLSVAFQLAERGAEVVVLERTGVAAEASGVQPGGVRQQWSTRVNCLLARESVGFYRELAERLEPRTSPRLETGGYLFLAHSDERLEALAADVAIQNEVGVPSVLVTPPELETLVPGMDVSRVTGASFCAETATSTSRRRSSRPSPRRVGAAGSRSSIPLLRRSSRTRSGCSTVPTTRASTPTPWSSPPATTRPRCSSLGVDVPIAKQARYLLLSELIRERLLEPLVVSTERRFAAKHLADGRMLAADLAADGDPDANAPRWRQHVAAVAADLLPILEYVGYPIVVEGFYDLTPDHQPVIGPVPGHDGLWLAAGFSGHGFMIAPSAGS